MGLAGSLLSHPFFWLHQRRCPWREDRRYGLGGSLFLGDPRLSLSLDVGLGDPNLGIPAAVG